MALTDLSTKPAFQKFAYLVQRDAFYAAIVIIAFGLGWLCR